MLDSSGTEYSNGSPSSVCSDILSSVRQPIETATPYGGLPSVGVMPLETTPITPPFSPYTGPPLIPGSYRPDTMKLGNVTKIESRLSWCTASTMPWEARSSLTKLRDSVTSWWGYPQAKV